MPELTDTELIATRARVAIEDMQRLIDEGKSA